MKIIEIHSDVLLTGPRIQGWAHQKSRDAHYDGISRENCTVEWNIGDIHVCWSQFSRRLSGTTNTADAPKKTQILMQFIRCIGSQHSSSERNLTQSCWRYEKQGRRSTSQQTFARWLELVQRCWCVNCCGWHKSAGATIGHRKLQHTNLRHHQNREASHSGIGRRFKLAEDVDFIFDSENRRRQQFWCVRARRHVGRNSIGGIGSGCILRSDFSILYFQSKNRVKSRKISTHWGLSESRAGKNQIFKSISSFLSFLGFFCSFAGTWWKGIPQSLACHVRSTQPLFVAPWHCHQKLGEIEETTIIKCRKSLLDLRIRSIEMKQICQNKKLCQVLK